jgi:hypothetical protein
MMRSLLAVMMLVAATVLAAEPSCSANLAVLPSHGPVNRHEVILEAYVNDAGPYEFLLDTGSQITMLDESLASELHVETTTRAAVVGVSLQGKGGKYALVNSVRVGENARVGSSYVLVLDMKDMHSAGYAVRGLIGEDFLSHFDAMIDNTHNKVCLKDVSN